MQNKHQTVMDKKVKGLPYGISSFEEVRNNDMYCVDKTMNLPNLGEGRALPVSHPSYAVWQERLPEHDARLSAPVPRGSVAIRLKGESPETPKLARAKRACLAGREEAQTKCDIP